MKPASIAVIKKELKEYSHQELVDYCLHLARFKKENKELLHYLLFESIDEDGYIEKIKYEIDDSFQTMNQANLYYQKKTIRKTLRLIKKYIRFSKKKETEATLLLHFCKRLGEQPMINRSQQLVNMYDRQIMMAKKAIKSLHEDLQYDYSKQLEELKNV